MANDNSSSIVSIVAIIAILLIVGAVLYFIFGNTRGSMPTQVDIKAPKISAPTTGGSSTESTTGT